MSMHPCPPAHLKQWCIFHPGTAFALALVPEGPSPAKHPLQTHLSCAGRTVVETARAHYGDVVGFMCKDRLWAKMAAGDGMRTLLAARVMLRRRARERCLTHRDRICSAARPLC